MTDPVPPSYTEEPLAIIEQEARAMAKFFGLSTPEEAAASLVERILLRLGGAHIYLPQRSPRSKQRVHEELTKKFNGRNLFELSKEYGMTPRHLRRILAGTRVR